VNVRRTQFLPWVTSGALSNVTVADWVGCAFKTERERERERERENEYE
jgi:hypothetical protein